MNENAALSPIILRHGRLMGRAARKDGAVFLRFSQPDAPSDLVLLRAPDAWERCRIVAGLPAGVSPLGAHYLYAVNDYCEIVTLDKAER